MKIARFWKWLRPKSSIQFDLDREGNANRLTNSARKLGKLPLHYLSQRRYQVWLGLGAVSLGSGILVLWSWQQFEASLPQTIDEALTYARRETLTIKAADGSVLREQGPVTHEKLKIWQIPDTLVNAFVASEDRRFYKHEGIDYQGITRATFANLRARRIVEGGSTITQQLSRIVFLDRELSFGRKFKEMRLSQKLEQQLSKEQILEQYLNLVYLGAGAYGVADAAWVYFSKSVEDLTLAEAATLAGITPAPSLYSPLKNHKAAIERRNLVLERMAAEGLITTSVAKSAIASPLVTRYSQPKRLQQQASYFTDYVQQELQKLIAPEILNSGGLVVETTLNPQWQKAAETAVAEAVKQYGSWQRFEQAALVALDPRNGQIRAMVGGKDYSSNQYNRVVQAQRQPGSTFKTFVYAAAIAAGFSPYKSFLDAEYAIDGYQPRNFGNQYRYSHVSLHQALTASLNVVAVRTLVDVGWNPTIKIAQQMGIESELNPTYSLALGASEVNLLELTNAYGTLANKGVYQKTYGISRVLDRQGNTIYEAKVSPQPALDPQSSTIMTWMLQDVVNYGTGQAAQIGRPVAGKTGTSDQARDLWFVGYIPQIVAGVWLGNDNSQETWGNSTTAAAVWRQFMLEAIEDLPVEAFPAPTGNLAEREGTIKAEPIKPKRSYYKQSPVPVAPARSYRRTRTYYQATSPQYSPPRRRRRYQPPAPAQAGSSSPPAVEAPTQAGSSSSPAVEAPAPQSSSGTASTNEAPSVRPAPAQVHSSPAVVPKMDKPAKAISVPAPVPPAAP